MRMNQLIHSFHPLLFSFFLSRTFMIHITLSITIIIVIIITILRLLLLLLLSVAHFQLSFSFLRPKLFFSPWSWLGCRLVFHNLLWDPNPVCFGFMACCYRYRYRDICGDGDYYFYIITSLFLLNEDGSS